MNYAKQAGSFSAGTSNYPFILSSNGYPTGTLATAISGNYRVPAYYFGRYQLSWSGQGGFTMQGPPAIVYSTNASGVVSGIAGTSGSVAANMSVLAKTDPVVVFAFGQLISSIADNGSGFVRLTTAVTNGFNNISNGSRLQINNISNFTNPDGGATVTAKPSTTTLDIDVAYSASMVAAGGGAGTQAEAILSASQVSFTFPTGAYSSMAGLVHCRIADVDGSNSFGLQNGYQINADLVAQIRELKPKYVRFLDSVGVIGSTESSYAYRPTSAYFTHSSGLFWYKDYQVGDITNNGADTYTCSNPSASGSGAYVDGEVVQGRFVGANTTVNPLINVNSRGAAPMFNNLGYLLNMVVTGTPTTGDTVTFTFTGDVAGSPYVKVYTVLSGDTTATILRNSLISAINADATLAAANISFNGTQGMLYNVNGISSITAVVGGAATEAVTLGRFAVGEITDNRLMSLTYSALLGGFIFAGSTGGLNGGMPQETLAELCNRANVGMYDHIPLFYTGAAVSAKISNIASLLRNHLPCCIELSNEVWNFAQPQTTQAQSLGLALNFVPGNLRAIYGFYALRVRQFMQLTAAEWTNAGRPRSRLNCTLQVQGAGNTSVTDTYRLKGTDLTTSNSYYAAKGGLGATAGTSYTSVGQRPIDVCDSMGYAIYWYGPCFNQGSQFWTGSINNLDAALQAGADYASGNPTLMANALTAVYNDLYNDTLDVGGSGDQSEYVTAQLTRAASWYTVAAAFDADRAGFGAAPLNITMYESGQQVSFSATAQNYTSSPTDLAARFAANGWDTSPYGASNTIVAQQLLNLWEAFKVSTKMRDITTALYDGVVASSPGREVNPASYQYAGPATWALFAGDLYSTKFGSYTAISNFNR